MTAWLQLHLLSFLIFGPMLWGVFLMAFRERQANLVRLLALLGATGFLVLTAMKLGPMDFASWGFAFEERIPWFTLAGLPVDYHVAVDGLNVWLVLLTTFLTPLAMVGTWKSLEKRSGTFFALLLILETGILGTLLAQDLLLFYVFWEVMLLPMVFIIGLWGGEERLYAAMKFVLFTLAGSLVWLVALLYLANRAGSFSVPLMTEVAKTLPLKTQIYLFSAFSLAFAIKVPLWPLHTWLPDAHVQAPTAGSVLLAGILLKLGGYGFLRFAIPIFPDAALALAKPIAILAVIAIIYGAWVSLVQWDLKKLVAYSSVSHMGFVVLGIFSFTPLGLQGAILQMLNHGVSTGALFLLVGMLYDRSHTRMIADFGGVATRMPIFSGFFFLVLLSSIGLPLTNGFVGEFLILNGSFSSGFSWGPPLAVLGSLGILFSAAYLLWMAKKVFWGPPNENPESGTAHLLEDLSNREIAVMSLLGILIFWAGLYPATFLNASEGKVMALLQSAGGPAPRVRSLPSQNQKHSVPISAGGILP